MNNFWNIPVTSTVLGSGHYGTVYKGYFGSFPVAVKTFKRSMDVEDFKAILVEAKIMAYVGGHPNVIHFWGAEVIGIMDRMCSSIYGHLMLCDQLGNSFFLPQER